LVTVGEEGTVVALHGAEGGEKKVQEGECRTSENVVAPEVATILQLER